MNAPKGEETIFAEALRLPPEERAGYLAQATSGDAKLCRRVEALLGSYQAGEFLEQAAAPESRELRHITIPITEKPGDRIGRYKLLQQIGEGGCGVVYMAEQAEPVRRRVALKIIKLGMDTKSVIARFEAERQALAMMDHPNIAKVFDAGATETGRPYFVMELVRGLRITDYCDEKKLPPRERLDLFIQVCHAIQHAHQKGIIHRDIKPSNIMVTVNDGVAVPKVIDFGIAKATSGQELTDKTLFTAFEQFIGTPAYMSPEQAVLTSLDIDTRSDIYALGVLLYELLTSKTPFDAKELLAIGLDEMRRTIREQEPPRPSTRLSTLPGQELSTTAQRRGLDAPKLVSELRGDLDWIVMKALEKDRTRRYDTANGLAADIQRYLNNEPVSARSPTKIYQFQKLVRRHKVIVAATAAVSVALLLGLVASTWLLVRERAARRDAVAAEKKAEQALSEAKRQRDAAVREQQRGDDQAAIAKAVNDFLQNDLLRQADVTEQADRGFAPQPDLTIKEALNRAAETVGRRFASQPLVEAAIWDTLAAAYRGMGEPLSAIRLLERSLALRRRHAGVEDPDTIRTMNGLARLYSTAEREMEAVQLFQEVLRVKQAALGSAHMDSLTVMGDLAETYFIAGRLAEALQMAEETLRLRKAQAGTDHPHVQGSMHFLATVYKAAGRLPEAISLFEETLKIRKATRGADNVRTLETMSALAGAYLASRRFAEAIELQEEVLALSKGNPGPDHPLTLWRMADLGEAYLAAGRLSQALPLLEKTLQLQKERVGPEHPTIFNTMYQLARAYRAAGRPAEAVSLCEEALRIRTARRGPDHMKTIAAMNHLAGAWIDQKNYSGAESLLLSAYEKLKQRGDGFLVRSEIETTLAALVQLYSNWGKPDEARQWQARQQEFNRSTTAAR